MRLDGVLGQRQAISRLEAEMASGRLAHAYLFTGPKGTGRATCAKALFKALNCEDKKAEVPCGVCPSCKKTAGSGHEDYIRIEPPAGSASAQIKVEQVREVIHTLSFAPFAGGTRLVLIKDAGKLNPSSANALLKTLEEPPANNILVLTVQDQAELLPTLVSRCRRISFQPLDQELIANELIRRGVDAEAASLKAAMSQGSLGQALNLDESALETALHSLKSHLSAPPDQLKDWAYAEEIVSAHRGKTIDRQGIARSLDLWAQYFRDQAVSAAGRPRAALLSHCTEGLAISSLNDCFSAVRKAQSRILSNASPELTLAVLLGRLHSITKA